MDWKTAAMQFARECEFDGFIDAVLATGSYASGNQDEHSDVDVYIVLSDEADWRERGNKRIGGYLIEYFANTERQITHEMRQYGSPIINMLQTAIVLEDKTGVTQRLIKLCELKHDNEQMPENDLRMLMYYLWDFMDELGRAYETKSPGFSIVYYTALEKASMLYSRFLSAPLPYITHMYRWVTDEGFRRKYGLPDFPDVEFTDKLLACYHAESLDEKYTCIKQVYAHIEKAIGGFDIDGFTLRRPCDVERKQNEN